MRTIPAEYRTPCPDGGLAYGAKYALLYTPAAPAEHISSF